MVGFFWAFLVVPSYERFVAWARAGSSEKNQEVLMASIGNVNFMLVSVGETFAPVLAGSVYDSLDFSSTMTGK